MSQKERSQSLEAPDMRISLSYGSFRGGGFRAVCCKIQTVLTKDLKIRSQHDLIYCFLKLYVFTVLVFINA